MNENRQDAVSYEAIAVDTQKIADFYQETISHYGDRSLMAARWSSEKKALLIHEGISNLPQQNWAELQAVLDIGSGQGYFLSFLREKRGFQGKYTGLELLPEFDKIAKQLYSNDPQAEFICAEFLAYQFGDRRFDWIFSIGSLSPKKPNQEVFDFAFTEKMAGLANKGFSIFLNDLKYIAPSRLEQVPELAVHNVDKFAEDLEKRFPSSKASIVHYPKEPSQHAFIHLVL